MPILTSADVAAVRNLVNKADTTDLKLINEILRAAYGRQQLEATMQFRVGDCVEFDGRRGRVFGRIEKINTKTIKVRQPARQSGRGVDVVWNVSPSLLRTTDPKNVMVEVPTTAAAPVAKKPAPTPLKTKGHAMTMAQALGKK